MAAPRSRLLVAIAVVDSRVAYSDRINRWAAHRNRPRIAVGSLAPLGSMAVALPVDSPSGWIIGLDLPRKSPRQLMRIGLLGVLSILIVIPLFVKRIKHDRGIENQRAPIGLPAPSKLSQDYVISSSTCATQHEDNDPTLHPCQSLPVYFPEVSMRLAN